jgi:hypothetical protein
MASDEKQLIKLFKQLAPSERETLLAFAEFLSSRSPKLTAPGPKPTPRHIPRPKEESVVAAIKRLSETYHMLDKPKLLNETSALMTQHIMQGRDLEEVIDEMEDIFRRHYEDWVNS